MKRPLQLVKRTMIIMSSAVMILIVAALLYLQHPQFGKAPSGERLERIRQSKNYSDGAFVNRSFTPNLTEGYSMPGIIYDFLFSKNPRQKPSRPIPSVRSDLRRFPADSSVLVWFGHSSYFLQIDGVKFLVDPVFSGNASPIPGSTKAFPGTDIYTVQDMPDIDFLVISHDHYDHLDYETVKALRTKVKKVICGLGVGAHFEHWGYAPAQLIEKDWDETVELGQGMKLHTLTGRHFSGRSFSRNNTLWLSYVLETPHQKLFIGGDSGYDGHFAEIGERFGSIDLAILENGQYNIAWHAIHCLPEEVLQAGRDLRAKRIMPVHSSKFSLALHDWDAPLKTVTQLNATYHFPLVTPLIGEVVHLDDSTQVFREWWKEVE